MREEDDAFVKQLSPRETWHAMGEGAFGRVARARLLGERVAVKEAVKSSKADALWNEVEYLRDFPHPNVTRYLGHYSDRRHGLLIVVMEFLPHCLRDKDTAREVDIGRAVCDVCRALASMHAEGIVHRDVKARNVLLTADLKTAKLGDFGLARHLPCSRLRGSHRSMTPRVGPPKYRAPEVEDGDDYGTPADMYSFGVMCNQLADLREPVGTEAEVAMLESLGKRCTRSRAERRPTARDVLCHLMEATGRENIPLGGFDPAGSSPEESYRSNSDKSDRSMRPRDEEHKRERRRRHSPRRGSEDQEDNDDQHLRKEKRQRTASPA